ncbi:MAG: hypothetical protein ACD_67C00044G0003 [uncultured bacterium]|nr:MAG: hypothetical protein ACD_67C00044G0003 [uncultured bacterium]
MGNQKSSDELAVALRVRVVREVAVPGNQINYLIQQSSALHSGINNFDKSRKAFMQTLLTEGAENLESGTLASTAGEIEEKYKQYVSNAELENEKAKDELEKLKSKVATLKEESGKVLAQIKEDVLAEKYGRGELIFTPEGLLRRIVGRIARLNESMDPVYAIVLGESDKHEASITEVAWLCENSDQHPPLFFVDIKLMPLNENELSSICWENDNYQLLVKNIPENQIVWPVGSVFRLGKSSMRELYLISRGGEKADVIRIEKSTYPHWKIEILGRTICNKENLKALCQWGGYNNSPVDLEAVPQDYYSSLNMMEWHLFRKYPGVMIEMPQWEGERLPIS